MRRISKILALLLCSGTMFLAGCRQVSPIGYYLAPPESLSRINRVVFVELSGQDSYPGIAADMTTTLSHAIQTRRLFRLDVVKKDDPLCKTISLDGQAGFTMQQLRDMRRTFQCDAILLGSVRDFRPHPRTQIGLDLRLLDLKNGRLVWAVDHIWDTTDREVEKRIIRFFNKEMRGGYEPMDWEFAMISPKAFGKFVAYEVANTLPDWSKRRPYKKRQQWTTLGKNK